MDLGNEGEYFSSTAFSTAAVYKLNFTSDTIAPGNKTYSKAIGSSVRCVNISQ